MLGHLQINVLFPYTCLDVEVLVGVSFCGIFIQSSVQLF